MALPSIMRIVDPLIACGLLIETGKASSTGGRKPLMLKMNGQYKYIIGVEVAMTTSVVLSNFSGDLIERWSDDNLNYKTPDHLLNKILMVIKTWLDDYKISQKDVAGIGVGTPGDSFKHLIDIQGSIIKGWDQVDVKAWFEDRVHFPVFIENVCRTQTISEIWFGHGKSQQDFLYVYLDQGVGSARVIQNTIDTGHMGVAGEFGHTSLDFKGRPCYCGKRGCIEMYISAGALINSFNQHLTQPIKRLNQLKEEDIKLLDQPIAEAKEVLAYGISNLINLYNPQVIVLGGLVSKYLGQEFKTIKDEVNKLTFNNNALNTPILLSGVNKAYLASVALVIQEHMKAFDQ